MLNSSKIFERFLQRQRFKKALLFCGYSVLDFGANRKELKQYLTCGIYRGINSYKELIKDTRIYTTICALAVVEHLSFTENIYCFKEYFNRLSSNGKIIITTPTLRAKPILDFLAKFNILDKKNIEEHKTYFTFKTLSLLAKTTGFKIVKYKKFQFGMNQLCIMEKRT